MLTGPLTVYTVLKWIAEGQQWINTAAEECVIDLADVSSIDSAGIALLLSWKRYAAQQKKKLLLINRPAKLQSMLELYGLNTVFAQ